MTTMMTAMKRRNGFFETVVQLMFLSAMAMRGKKMVSDRPFCNSKQVLGQRALLEAFSRLFLKVSLWLALSVASHAANAARSLLETHGTFLPHAPFPIPQARTGENVDCTQVCVPMTRRLVRLPADAEMAAMGVCHVSSFSSSRVT